MCVVRKIVHKFYAMKEGLPTTTTTIGALSFLEKFLPASETPSTIQDDSMEEGGGRQPAAMALSAQEKGDTNSVSVFDRLTFTP
jgi:hypothetical protein